MGEKQVFVYLVCCCCRQHYFDPVYVVYPLNMVNFLTFKLSLLVKNASKRGHVLRRRRKKKFFNCSFTTSIFVILGVKVRQILSLYEELLGRTPGDASVFTETMEFEIQTEYGETIYLNLHLNDDPYDLITEVFIDENDFGEFDCGEDRDYRFYQNLDYGAAIKVKCPNFVQPCTIAGVFMYEDTPYEIRNGVAMDLTDEFDHCLFDFPDLENIDRFSDTLPVPLDEEERQRLLEEDINNLMKYLEDKDGIKIHSSRTTTVKNYKIEMHFVVVYDVYDRFYSMHKDREAALRAITEFIEQTGNEMDMIFALSYKGQDKYKYTIDIVPLKLTILEYNIILKKSFPGLAYSPENLNLLCRHSSYLSAASVEIAVGLTGSTAAHELVHTFGVNHDGVPGTGSACPASDQYLMSASVNPNDMSSLKAQNPFKLSSCSLETINSNLHTIPSVDGKTCLEVHSYDAAEYDKILKGPYLGTRYSAKVQCQFVHGAKSDVCPISGMSQEETCWRGIYCKTGGSCNQAERIQPFIGTPCGANKMCMLGKCVDSTASSGTTVKPKPVTTTTKPVTKTTKPVTTTTKPVTTTTKPVTTSNQPVTTSGSNTGTTYSYYVW
ncbi:A disintegrin and metalloproteinase with thrombospondin motifs 13 [Mactra antiquata]